MLKEWFEVYVYLLWEPVECATSTLFAVQCCSFCIICGQIKLQWWSYSEHVLQFPPKKHKTRHVFSIKFYRCYFSNGKHCSMYRDAWCTFLMLGFVQHVEITWQKMYKIVRDFRISDICVDLVSATLCVIISWWFRQCTRALDLLV